MRDPVLIGLTGPIGCGKSTVGGMLTELGGVAIDADALARDVTAPGTPALDAIRARFGAEVLTPAGALDRAALAAIVFVDPAALADLEAITHPGVRVRFDEALAHARNEDAPFVTVEAIKLVEGGLADRCDEVWLLDCDAVAQRARLAERGMAADDIERRIAAQGDDLAERLSARVDRTIRTDGSLESVRERVEDALADVLADRFGGLPIGPLEPPSGSG